MGDVEVGYHFYVPVLHDLGQSPGFSLPIQMSASVFCDQLYKSLKVVHFVFLLVVHALNVDLMRGRQPVVLGVTCENFCTTFTTFGMKSVHNY